MNKFTIEEFKQFITELQQEMNVLKSEKKPKQFVIDYKYNEMLDYKYRLRDLVQEQRMKKMSA